jgi:mannose-6-phosphate isomerase-like protein (cupin superfamily)
MTRERAGGDVTDSASTPEYRVIEAHELQQFTHTDEFEGDRYGVGTSFILVDMPPGSGVRLHRHTYAEIFIVQEGQATYTVGSSTLEVKAPRILLVAAATPHAFVNSGDGPLKQVDIHLSPRIITEWLEPPPGSDPAR